MNWYNWLNVSYKRIINSYIAGKGHHALLLHVPKGIGEESLSLLLVFG